MLLSFNMLSSQSFFFFFFFIILKLALLRPINTKKTWIKTQAQYTNSIKTQRKITTIPERRCLSALTTGISISERGNPYKAQNKTKRKTLNNQIPLPITNKTQFKTRPSQLHIIAHNSQFKIKKNKIKNWKIKKKEERDLGIDEIAGEARAARLAEAVDDGVHLGLQGAPFVHQSHRLRFHVRRHHCYGCVFRSPARWFYQRLSFERWVLSLSCKWVRRSRNVSIYSVLM